MIMLMSAFFMPLSVRILVSSLLLMLPMQLRIVSATCSLLTLSTLMMFFVFSEFCSSTEL